MYACQCIKFHISSSFIDSQSNIEWLKKQEFKEKFEITQKCMKKSRERKNEKQNLKNKIRGNS